MASRLELVEHFVAVIEAGSFTAAAEQTGTSKSTLSRQVSELEALLDVSLLVRTTRTVTPTEYGAMLYKQATEPIEVLNGALANVQSGQDQLHGTLKITTTESLAAGMVTKAVAGFCRSHPNVSVQQLITNRLVDLVEEGVDMAIRIGAPNQPNEASPLQAGLWHEYVGDSPIVVCMSPSLQRQIGTPDSYADLASAPMITLEARRTQFWQTFGLSEKEIAQLTTPHFTFSTNSMQCLLSAALEGMGIAVLPLGLCREHLDNGLLVRLLPEAFIETPTIQVVTPQERSGNPKVAAFRDLIRSNLAALNAKAEVDSNRPSPIREV